MVLALSLALLFAVAPAAVAQDEQASEATDTEQVDQQEQKKNAKKPRKRRSSRSRRSGKKKKSEKAKGKKEGATAPQDGAQHPSAEKAKPACDTVVTISGRKIPCNIRVVNNRTVSFYPLGKRKVKSLKRKKVNRVIYRDGRIDKITALAAQEIDDTDWRIVIVTEDEAMVQGLYPKGVVKAESRSKSPSLAKARQNAETRLKKQVIRKGGTYVLVKNRKTQGGYGEIPTYIIEGEAYGTEPGNADSAKAADKKKKKKRSRRSRRRY
ncbi:MAG: hypothetical protein CSA97_02550 [Bacteroidetes bacterium]|nr:MAG: hypothetical protein CSA97_02550 [Bacteroidota bacterium]